MPACLDLSSRLRWGQLCLSPLQPGCWTLLEPAGSQNHAPQLAWLPDGRLACVWMAGAGEGTAGMAIHISWLRPGAGRWSRPRLVSQDPTRSEQNPLLFVTERGLQLIHTAQRCRDPQLQRGSDGLPFSMQWTAVLRSQQRRLPRGRWGRASDLLAQPAFCRHPPHRRADGCWLLPIYRCSDRAAAFGADHSEVLVLEADGQFSGSVIPVPGSIGRVHGSIVPSADGHFLLQFFRSRLADRIYWSRGSLDGLSWSEPLPTPLPNNNSSMQALRLHNGLLAMIFNRCCAEAEPVAAERWGEAIWPRSRWPLSVALSADDGESWPWIRDLDHGLGFSGRANHDWNAQLAYPAMLEGPTGVLHIAYSWSDRAAIRYLRLPVAEILGQELVP